MAHGQPIGLPLVADLTPQLGGDLDGNTKAASNMGRVTISTALALVLQSDGANKDFLLQTNTGLGGRIELVSVNTDTTNVDKAIFSAVGGTGIITFGNGVVCSGTLDMEDNPIGDVGYIDFNLVNGVSPAEGRLVWNDVDGTLNLGLKGGNVNLQMGLEQVIRGKNATGTGTTNGKAARISGASGSTPEFGFSDADDPATAGVIGLFTEDINTNANGYVTTFGLVRDIDTTGGGEAWSAADRIFVSDTPGGLTNVYPTGTSRVMFVGIVMRAHATEGVILVHTINQAFLSELSGVTFTSIAEGQLIYYDADTGVWKNTSVVTIDDVTDSAYLGDGGTTDYLDVSSTGDVVFKGSAGLIYAGIFVKESVATISVDADNADVLVTQWTDNSPANNATSDQANSKITITVAGTYHITFHAAVNLSSGVTTVLELNGYINGVIQPPLHMHRTVSSVDIGSMSFGAVVNVPSVPVDLDVRANIASSTARDLTVEDAQLNVIQIGG